MIIFRALLVKYSLERNFRSFNPGPIGLGPSTVALVVQRTEHRFAEPAMPVRFWPRALMEGWQSGQMHWFRKPGLFLGFTGSNPVPSAEYAKGGLAEWTNALVLKTRGSNPYTGSNPVPTALRLMLLAADRI